MNYSQLEMKRINMAKSGRTTKLFYDKQPLVFNAGVLFLPFGAFYARYFRSVEGWVILKIIVQSTGSLLSIVFLVVIISSGVAFDQVHSYIGAAIMFFVLIQIVIAFLPLLITGHQTLKMPQWMVSKNSEEQK